MRDLSRYPITLDEIISGLQDLRERLTLNAGVGDIQPLLVAEAIKLLKQQRCSGETGTQQSAKLP